MPGDLPPGVDRFRDRHGKLRLYFRIGKGARTPLPADPRSPEFWQAYQALAGVAPAPAKPKPRDDPDDRTIAALAKSYFRSAAYLDLKPSTKIQRYRYLTRFVDEYGDRGVAGLKAKHITAILEKMADRPEAANNLRKVLRLVMKRALQLEWITADPTAAIVKRKGGHWRSWTDEEIHKFEAHWPIGTQQRLAFALQHFTGQRRSDVVHMTRSDLLAGRIRVVQVKTGNKVSVPLHPELSRVIAGTEIGKFYIIERRSAKPRTVNGYGNWLSDAIRAAGLSEECVTHGLRKAAGRRLIEAGATTKQVMAILGLTTLAMAELYTLDAENSRLADAGMAHWGNTNSQPDEPSFSQTGKG